jgi:hypothetical protein
MEIGGLAAGAVALVPLTLQMIDLCTTFYSEVQHFGRSTQQYNLKFTHLRSRYDALQRMLFQHDKFPFAPAGLFRYLSEQDQRVIYAMLQELARLFYKHYTIGQTYRLRFELPEPNLPDVEALAAALTMPNTDTEVLSPSDKYSSLLSVRHIWWANRGKKRAERLLTDFQAWLRRIRDILEDTWWLLPAFGDAANLRSLERDADAGDLGISAAAGLKKLTLDENAPVDLSRDTVDLVVTYLNPQRGIATFNGEPILVEALSFEPDKDGFISKTLRQRFETISNLLHTQRDPDLRVLHCTGHRFTTSPVAQFQLLLEIPSNCAPKPTSLQEMLALKLRIKPDLGHRFRLCWQLAQSLIGMHSVGWLHRGLRSENVVYFPPMVPSLDNESLVLHFFKHFVISGFDSSRLETDFSLGPYDNTIDKNIYRHPERWGAPRRTFSRIHDIYGEYIFIFMPE